MKSEILELLRFNDKIDNQTSFASVVLENDKIVILALENDNEILKKELEANDFKSFFGEINNKVVFGYDIKSIYRHFLSLGCSEKELSEVQIYDILLSSYISNCNTTHSFEDILTRFNTKLELMDDQIKTSKIENILLIGLDYYFSFDDKLRFLWKNIESDSSLPLAIMEHIGVKFDSQKLLDLKNRYIIEKNEIEQKIKDLLSDQNINLNSSVQLGTALINAGFALKQTGKSGNVSTNESVLEELKIADTTGVIDLILEYRAISKMISTYTDSLLERVNKNTQRINGTYIQTGSATGRLASINPNLQNIPIKNPKFGPDLRACFITDSDKYLVSFDYSQIELRILAHCSDDDELIRAFENNIDIHTLTAARIFDKNVNEITKKERSVGKTLNFALMYQQGYLATAKQLSISNKESKEYHAKYFEKFVKIKPFIDQTIQFAKENGYVETIYGRKSYYPDINSTDPFIQSNAKRAAFNMPIQGTEADIVKLAMNKILAFFIEKNLNSKMLMQIHDEIVLEVPKSELEIILKAIPKIMLLDNPLKVPLIVEYHYGDNWNQK
jgi:DNA polymerase-1